jgi:hypothetical protein
VPVAACCTLRAISWVAEPCSSTAAAMAAAISLISLIVFPIPRMESTASLVAVWICVIWRAMSSVAFAVWVAKGPPRNNRIAVSPRTRE